MEKSIDVYFAVMSFVSRGIDDEPSITSIPAVLKYLVCVMLIVLPGNSESRS